MVTCTKCGTKNADDAQFCINCGAAINMTEINRRRGSGCFGSDRRMENECFGIPNGGTIVGLLIGIIIIIYGLGNLFGWRIDFGPLVLVLIGGLIVIGALYGLARKR